MIRMLALVAAAALLTTASVVAHASASRSTSHQASTVDRTFVCKTTRVVVEGYPDSFVSEGITVGMSPPTRTTSGALVAGSVGIWDENAGPLVAMDTSPTGGRSAGGISVWTKQCTPTKAVRVPLSADGLPVRADRIQQRSYDCIAPRRIHVRVRAVLSHPRRWKVAGDVLGVKAPRLREVQLAIRTPSGKPLAFAKLELQSLRGELSVSRKSPRCVAS